ncbi:unnamed protein product [Closterium sp. Naga37s-1]|nr:unnamed protein product [Closterium sp. Naga37s-1]
MPRLYHRSQLAVHIKRAICAHSVANPKLRHADLARWCFTRFRIRPDRSTIGRVLKGAEQWACASSDNNIVRVRGGAHPDLKRAMARWIANAGPAGVPLTLATIRDHVANMAREQGLPATFRCSIGWGRRGLRRQGVTCMSACGEAADQDLTAIRTTQEKLPQLLMHLSVTPKDTYNFDETALFISVLPRKTYGNGRVAGRKLAKERLTVGFLVKADGLHSFRPLVISKAKRPHDFRPDYDPEELFTHFIEQLNAAMYAEDRNIVVLLDNASSHVLKSEGATSEDLFGFRTRSLSNVRLVYLPPNTTCFTQPLDQGLIVTAKARYRAHWLSSVTALWTADGATPAARSDAAIGDVGILIDRLGLGPDAMLAAEFVRIDDNQLTCAEPAVYDDGNPESHEARRYARVVSEMLIDYAKATGITPRDLCALFDIRNPIIRARMECASLPINLNMTPPPSMPLAATPSAETPRRHGRVLPAWMTEPTLSWATLAQQAARRQELIDGAAPAVMQGYLDAAEWMRL